MKIRINGSVREIAEPATVERLVADLRLHRAVIAVELNREVVRRGDYAARTLEPGDEVEIVTLVGGG
jgi:thiamine biosynthesis protein ThiS